MAGGPEAKPLDVVCLSSVWWSRTILDGSVLRHRLHRRSACVSAPSGTGAEARSLHQNRACEGRSIPSCDFRLARRHEVPVLREAVLAGGRRSGQSIPSGSRPLVRRATRRTDAGAYRLIPVDYSTVERLTLTMARDR